ncbi:MAG: glycosyltransferase [Gemmatimonadaceae bacterium]
MAAAFGHWWQSGGERPDVIFACVPSLELAEAAVEAGAALRTPVVVDVRDPWPDVYLSVLPRVVRPLARHFLSPEYRRLQRIVQGASAVTAVSGDYLQWALQVAERAPTDHDRVFPIGFAVDPGPPIAWGESVIGRRLSIPDADMVVAFGGMFGTSYDLDTVVEAARLLERTPGHRIRFVIAGDGDKAASLRRRARDLQSLVFCGWLDERDMRALLGRAAVGLAAYAAEAQQSLPNKPFEYMASGLALVSSLTGELADLIAREGIGRQFTARNATSLARELLWLWQHPEERTQMGARAHHLLSTRYHAARIDQSLAEHLRGIAAGGVPVTQDAATLASELPRQEAAV